MAWCGMNSHYCIEHVIISIRLIWSLYPPPPGTRAVLQSTVGAGGPWLQSTATPAAPGCGVQPPLLPQPYSFTLVRLTRSKVTNRLLFYYSDIAIFGDVVGGAGVGSVNQTAPGILLQQIAEELPVEVLNLSSTNYTFPMPKYSCSLVVFASISKTWHCYQWCIQAQTHWGKCLQQVEIFPTCVAMPISADNTTVDWIRYQNYVASLITVAISTCIYRMMQSPALSFDLTVCVFAVTGGDIYCVHMRTHWSYGSEVMGMQMK